MIKNFIKPSTVKVLLFLILTTFSLYATKENACGAGLFFSFCYKAYGFPLLYFVTGQIDAASGYFKTLPFGSYFIKFNNFLFNIPAFALDIVLIYLFACLIVLLLSKIKTKI